MIAIDDTYLKGLYHGMMFMATCLNENNELHLLTIQIYDSKDNDSWKCFMIELHVVIGDRVELVIISY